MLSKAEVRSLASKSGLIVHSSGSLLGGHVYAHSVRARETTRGYEGKQGGRLALPVMPASDGCALHLDLRPIWDWQAGR